MNVEKTSRQPTKPESNQKILPLEMDSLHGTFDHTVYANEETGWTIGRLLVKGVREAVTLVGPYTAVPGETLQCEGEWIRHPKFGRQFKVHSFMASNPATLDGLKRYLSSGLIKGIGKAYAERLIEKFGLNVTEVIEQKPFRLLEVEGIGRNRQTAIVEGWNAHRAIKDIMVFLQSFGVGTAFAVRIYKTYGSDSIRKVRENPYRLATEIHGVGFKTADRVAEKLGIKRNSAVRIEAGLHYVLSNANDREGHVYLKQNELVERSQQLLEVELGEVEATLETALKQESVPLVREGEAIYVRKLLAAEKAVAKLLEERLTAKSKLRPIDWDKFFVWLKQHTQLEFSDEQKHAIAAAYEGPVCVITGGPGTGKSTAVQALTHLFARLGIHLDLCAPTGRAAKRLLEVTGKEAKTLHRLLEFEPGAGFKRNQDHPLEASYILVDETSMVDLQLFQALLRAIPKDTRLVLVGDVDQLPSVGAGDVLADLIRSRRIPTVRLTQIYRQAAESRIIQNAHRIHRGELPESGDKESGGDFYFIRQPSPELALPIVVELCTKRLPEKFGLNPLTDIQVLLPMHRGVLGTQNLNVELQKRLSGRGPFLERADRKFFQGDRVIQTRNDYDREVFNGDIGIVTFVDLTEYTLTVKFDSRDVIYEKSDLDELDLAYAISIHKSQGSEFKAVVIPLVTQHAVLLQRNLIYTAVTRGKKLVVIVGAPAAVEMAVKRDGAHRRNSGLAERLIAKALPSSLDAAPSIPNPALAQAPEPPPYEPSPIG